MQHPNDDDNEDDLLINHNFPKSETNVTLLFDDDLV